MRFLRTFALAGVILTAGFAESKAALIEYTGTEDAQFLPDSFNPNGSTTLTAGGLSITEGSAVSLYVGGGLKITQDAHLTFTYLGYEAGFQNKFNYSGVTQFTTRQDNSSTPLTPLGTTVEFDYFAGVTPNVLDFSFWSSEAFVGDPVSHGGLGVLNVNGSYDTNEYSIGFAARTPNSVILLFGDGVYPRDNDFDDMAVLLEVTAIPLPPSAILFGTALLGLAGLRRRKRKAA